MKKLMMKLMMAALLVTFAAHAEVQLGKDYTMLNPAQPASTSKIEVQEYFFYQCPHCFHLHPYLAKWEKSKAPDVEISYVPTTFRNSAIPLAYAYFALKEMGQIKQLDDAIYQAIHVSQINLYDQDTIGAFVSKHGVDRTEFAKRYTSFSVDQSVKNSKILENEMTRGIDPSIEYGFGTPTLLVDGKYVITNLQPEDTIRVLNEVIAKVRKARAPASGKKHKTN